MNILIIYGGKSCEHDISLITACLSKGYFDGKIFSAYFDKQNNLFWVPNNYTPTNHLTKRLKNKMTFCFGEGKILVHRGKRIIKNCKIDVAVNCCHGLNGEDGAVAALCQMAGIPLVGSNILSSSISMDKIATKIHLKSLGLPVLPSKSFSKQQFDQGKISVGNLGFPVVVKPSRLGSSIGISRCENKEQLVSALEKAFEFDCKVLCEKALTDFVELNCSAMRVKGEVVCSDLDCPVTVNDILTFEDKYVNGSSVGKVSVEEQTSHAVKNITKSIYEQLNFEGVIRVDFLMDKNTSKLYVNEINSIPGSLAYGLWSKKYSQFQFGKQLVEQALQTYYEKNKFIYNYSSSVLDGTMRKK